MIALAGLVAFLSEAMWRSPASARPWSRQGKALPPQALAPRRREVIAARWSRLLAVALVLLAIPDLVIFIWVPWYVLIDAANFGTSLRFLFLPWLLMVFRIAVLLGVARLLWYWSCHGGHELNSGTPPARDRAARWTPGCDLSRDPRDVRVVVMGQPEH